ARIAVAETPTYITILDKAAARKKAKLEGGSSSAVATAASVLPETELLQPVAEGLEPLPPPDASGGILTAWDDREWACTSVCRANFSLFCSFESRASSLAFFISNVYGPCEATDKPIFLEEISSIGRSLDGPWAILGDFNFVLRPNERSNANFNAPEAAAFSATINSLQLQELPLLGRAFTWSNQQEVPTLVRLDRALVNLSWSSTFPDSTTSFIPRSTSDHVPIILSAATN
ncbi:hypothetical protein BRADI_2g40912v3, partial [Brachypodium distachyon]